MLCRPQPLGGGPAMVIMTGAIRFVNRPLCRWFRIGIDQAIAPGDLLAQIKEANRKYAQARGDYIHPSQR